jgi:hypothetical protein
MRTTIFLLFLLAVSAKAQDCNTKQILAYNRDLSGVMATPKKDGDFKCLEMYMFLSKKAAFDKNNAFEIILTDSTVITGVFAESGKTIYNDAVGQHVIEIKVFFPYEYLDIMTRVPVARIKMRGNGEDIEMLGIGKENKLMQTILCIL